MRVEGRERATHGFEKAPDGWHLVEIDEGIDYAKDKETGAIRESKKGDKQHNITFVIHDDEDIANGSKIFYSIWENNSGEQTIADILAATGQYKKFAEKFPGDISVFDINVMSMIKIKLPGQFLKIRTELDKAGYPKVKETATVSFDPAKDEKAKGKGKDKAADKAETKTAAKSDEW